VVTDSDGHGRDIGDKDVCFRSLFRQHAPPNHVSRGAVHLGERHDVRRTNPPRQRVVIGRVRERQVPGRKQMWRQRLERPAAKRGAPGFSGPVEGFWYWRKGHIGLR